MAARPGQSRQPTARRPSRSLAPDHRFDQTGSDRRLPVQHALHLFNLSAVGQTVNQIVQRLGEGSPKSRPRSALERSQRRAMVRRREGEDFGAAAVEAARLERDLHRVGARGGKVDSRLSKRRQIAERLAEFDAGRMSIDVAQSVEEAIRLPLDRRDHDRMPVAHRGDSESGRQVEVAIAVDIEHVAAESLLPQHRGASVAQGVDPRRLGRFQACGGSPGPRPRRRRSDLWQLTAAVESVRPHRPSDWRARGRGGRRVTAPGSPGRRSRCRRRRADRTPAA